MRDPLHVTGGAAAGVITGFTLPRSPARARSRGWFLLPFSIIAGIRSGTSACACAWSSAVLPVARAAAQAGGGEHVCKEHAKAAGYLS